MPVSAHYRPEQRHARLGDAFFDEVEAAAFPRHVTRFRNHRWAARVGAEVVSTGALLTMRR